MSGRYVELETFTKIQSNYPSEYQTFQCLSLPLTNFVLDCVRLSTVSLARDFIVVA